MLSILNGYCHGYVATPLLLALEERGVFAFLAGDGPLEAQELAAKSGANLGYLQIALHALESLGRVQLVDGKYALSPDWAHGRPPAEFGALYDEEIQSLLVSRSSQRCLLSCLKALAAEQAEGAESLFEGAVLLPLVITLKAGGPDTTLDVLDGLEPELRAAIEGTLRARGFLRPGERVLSELGRQLVDRAYVMAIAGSYRPMLAQSRELLFGNARLVFAQAPGGPESHVDRRLNVIASGFQHQSYFRDAERLVVEIFNREPMDSQPRYIADMGCGDGTFLKQLWEAVRRDSVRGKRLADFPLTLIGIDRSPIALEQTTQTLAGVPHLVVPGDINEPGELMIELARRGVSSDEVLHVRSFLDHNFNYGARKAEEVESVSVREPGAVYVDEDGLSIDPAQLLSAVRAHLARWAEVVPKHGLVVLESHCIPPRVVREHFETSESFYFDTLHALSKQYLIDAESFLICAANVGLFATSQPLSYPRLLDFRRVTLGHLEKRGFSVRYASPNDLDVLEELEARCWPEALRTPRSELAARIARYPRGQFVLVADGRVLSAAYSQRIDDEEALRGATAHTTLSLHRDQGPVVQLISVSVLPEAQERNLGDQFLEFMLQRSSVMNGIRSVVGITRCRSYEQARHGSLEEYVSSRDEYGNARDPILNFHEVHGARVGGVLPGYRPEDVDNQGAGVWVHYDIHTRRRRSGSAPEVCNSEATASTAANDLQRMILQCLGEPGPAAYDPEAPLMEMGLNSSDLLGLGERIRRRYAITLGPTFFFQYRTPRQIAEYLGGVIAPQRAEASDEPGLSGDAAEPSQVAEFESRVGTAEKRPPVADAAPIAIVGMACRLPGGVDGPEQLWSLLSSGSSIVGQLPLGRFQWPSGIDPRGQHAGIDRGGFFERVDEFDAAFFRISPREAELLDPQQRLLLELSWHALEDAGYARDRLAGSDTGVFVGASGSDYARLLNEAGVGGDAHSGTGSAVSVLANRVSYFFDWHGPSLCVDTACSSSLVAVHQAIHALRGGDCRTALVGGVNLICHPANSVAYYRAGMLAKDGRCKTFDARADGYVRGEGAAILLLKPLADAIRDGDRIYATILGSATNHGGLASGLTVPNPEQQARLYTSAFRAARVEPGHVGYVEAHGTGTALGDPIEIQGLRSAIGMDAKDPRCFLGSIKSNVGHLEAAAGIIGLVKAALCVQRGEIPASLHFSELNPHIDLTGTRFSIASGHCVWPRPDGAKRIAAVSSFGSGGANAHAIVAEHVETPRLAGAPGEQVVLLSARDPERLDAYVAALRGYLTSAAGSSLSITDVAYTLQRRQSMDARLAIVVDSVAELVEKLEYIARGESVAKAYRGLRESRASEPFLLTQTDVRAVFDRWLQDGEVSKLARVWTDGADVNWQSLRCAGRPRVVSLPGYPFLRARHWLTKASDVGANRRTEGTLHPLLHRNTSDLAIQRFGSTFSGDEFFFADHVVKGVRLLPGVAHLEMARAALERSLPELRTRAVRLRLSDIVWARAVIFEPKFELSIELAPEADERIRFEISAGDGSQFSHGHAVAIARDAPLALDLHALRARCSVGRIEHDACYEAFRAMGIDYGPAHRGVELVQVGEQEALVKLRLPNAVAGEAGDYALHPALLDAALQLALLMAAGVLEDLAAGAPVAPALTIPYDLARFEIYGACTASMWAWVRFSSGSHSGSRVKRFDVTLCDEAGVPCCEFVEFSSRPYDGDKSRAPRSASSTALATPNAEPPSGELLLAPLWEPMQPKFRSRPISPSRVVVAGGNGEQLGTVRGLLGAIRTLDVSPTASVEEIAARLSALGECEHLIWIAEELTDSELASDALIAAQEANVIRLYRTVRALHLLGYDAREFECTIVTTHALSSPGAEGADPAQAAVHGFAGALAKERPSWKILLADLESSAAWPGDLFQILSESAGRVLAHRGGRWLSQQLIPASWQPAGSSPPYRRGGVYLVVGGAGSVGVAFSQFLIEHWDARVVWLGRREKTPEIERELSRLGTLGTRPLYLSVDARDELALRAACQRVRTEYGAIHGIVHAAMTLADCPIEQMTELQLREVLSAKVDVSVRLAQVFSGERLDFALFFSSLVSLVKNAQQGHYAAGCAFKDAFALRLASLWPCPVKVVNWGYWGEGADVADSTVFRKLSQIGIGRIERAQGMRALDALFGGPLPQLAAIKTDKPVPIEGLNSERRISLQPLAGLPATPLLGPAPLPTAPLSGGVKLNAALDRAVLKVVWSELQSMGLFEHEYVKRTELTRHVRGQSFYGRWLAETLASLASAGYLDEDKDGYWVVDPSSIDRHTSWTDWQEVTRAAGAHPDTCGQVRLLDVCLRAIPGLLRGEELATDVLFPNGTTELVSAIYERNAAADYFNDVAADAVAKFAAARLRSEPSAKLRLLEVGAGTGATSAKVLERLAPYRTSIAEYCYTDLSKAFLLRADAMWGREHPYLRTRILDAERPADADPLQYDLLIATNVIHATRDIGRTLRNLKPLLKRGGWLVLNELSERTLLTHLTFGLLEGFWLYEDAARRIPGSPALSAKEWAKVLAECGFHELVLLTSPELPGQQVLVSASDAVLEERAPARAAQPIDQPASVRNGLGRAPLEVPSIPNETRPASTTEPGPAPAAGLLREKATAYFKRLIGDVLKLPPTKIRDADSFESLGIDSILAIQITTLLRKDFGSVSSTLLFEVGSVEALRDHFLSTREARLREIVGLTSRAEQPSENPTRVSPVQAVSTTAGRLLRREPKSAPAPVCGRMDIAVVGLAGRYAQADDVDELWRNLREGRSCISEIPSERWDWRTFFDQQRGKEGAIYTKWGGFVRDIDKFDPLFFQISPREAELMDPQERLFLETAYSCLQDAGYTPANVSRSRRVGVFVGVMNATYPVKPNYFSIANRVSFSFDLHGPSMAVDTACSSSATALHLALESLYSGSSEVAIAGGVNLVVSPQHYVNLCRLTMLSSDGDCKAFGDRADGFVDGEGVGAVLLKPLSAAIEDGDNIYAVLKGSAINAGGRTNGYTVPSPVAQGELIAEALARAGVNARAVSYVEAHGTGTILGDPIEVSGLSRAYAQHTSDRGYCALGSVKPNIGHCESAAGIAGLTKILLQLRHGELVPSLHSREQNPNIEFALTPFVVQQALSEWKRPSLGEDQNLHEYPRTAGLSSFGAGGSNAHVIVQEFMAEDVALPEGQELARVMVPLSARSEERLRESARRLLSFLRPPASTCPPRLSDVAYTLQVGRESMSARVGFIVTSLDQLAAKLEAFLGGDPSTEDIYASDGQAADAAIVALAADPEWKMLIAQWYAKGKLSSILQLWVRGVDIPWSEFHAGRRAKRISLPTYPFVRQSCWISEKDSIAAGGLPPRPVAHRESLPEAAKDGHGQWLFARERWTAESLSGASDWHEELAQKQAQRVWIVPCGEGSESQPLSVLLQQISVAAGLAQPFSVRLLSSAEAESDRGDELPDVVFVLGPTGAHGDPAGGAELADVFRVGAALMRRGWEQRVLLYYIYDSSPEQPQPASDALAGFFRSAMLENPRHVWKSIAFDPAGRGPSREQILLQEWLRASTGQHFEWVRYSATDRLVWRLERCTVPTQGKTLFRSGGTYLVVGGLGPVGQLLCESLAKRLQPTLIVVSRAPWDADKAASCRRLESLGAKVRYEAVDICDEVALASCFDGLRRDGLQLNGVIHLARWVEDGLLATKTWASIERVVAAKVRGTVNLDRLTADEPLDFFMLFGSIATYGLRGGADYAYSAAFQDAFVRYRELLRGRGQRSGRSLAQAWGAWSVDKYQPENRHAKFEALGFDFIDAERALDGIERSVESGEPALAMVLVTESDKAEQALGLARRSEIPAPASSLEAKVIAWEAALARGEKVAHEVTAALDESLLAKLDTAMVDRLYKLMFSSDGSQAPLPERDSTPPAEGMRSAAAVKRLVAETLAAVLKLNDVDPEQSFQNYGLDSISAMRLSTRLERALGIDFSPQWLIDFPSVNRLSRWLSAKFETAPAALASDARSYGEA